MCSVPVSCQAFAKVPFEEFAYQCQMEQFLPPSYQIKSYLFPIHVGHGKQLDTALKVS